MLDVHAVLREVSVVDAQKILATARAEKATKEKEMQAMGGSRYQDLIDAADEIVRMHEASQRLDTALREMPSLWDSLESSVALVMEPTAENGSFPTLAAVTLQTDVGNYNYTDVVDIVVSASERMPTTFYEDALFVIRDLEPTSTATSLCAEFLDGRDAAATTLRQSRSLDKQHVVMKSLQLILSTFDDATAIFAAPSAKLFDSVTSVSHHELEAACTTWAIEAIRNWRADLDNLLTSLHDVEAVATLQQSMQNLLEGHRGTLVAWCVVHEAMGQSPLDDVDLWGVFASDLFAKTTQSLFRQAFDAAATQLTSALNRYSDDVDDDAANDSNDKDVTASFVARLVAIQRSDCAQPTLQPILASECLRVLYNVVTTLVDTSFSTAHLLQVAQHCLDLSAAMPTLFLPDSLQPSAASGAQTLWLSIQEVFKAHAADDGTTPDESWLPF
ncbi:hypothetical protein DYB32_004151 [Aphanomyces invadans]|uniref:Conserved oligomeric Golgi complex subunit 1 n=1 Tax=Aphanomyces invadans TaxID=157072 RepID=A0A3R7D1N4_9STRA|nr:hypothetical protein DYB32_004151 [Aphanomyces invadans]